MTDKILRNNMKLQAWKCSLKKLQIKIPQNLKIYFDIEMIYGKY